MLLWTLVGTAGALAVFLLILRAVVKGAPATRGEKLAAVLLLGILPGLWLLGTMAYAMETMKKVDFCSSCHTMEPYEASLHADDEDSIVANHYRNNWIPQKKACYACHAGYTVFGEMKAKLTGLKHVMVYYSGKVPDKLHLYEPYDMGNCLQCHGPAESFREAHFDADAPEDFEKLQSGETSCFECHDVNHVIATEPPEGGE